MGSEFKKTRIKNFIKIVTVIFFGVLILGGNAVMANDYSDAFVQKLTSLLQSYDPSYTEEKIAILMEMSKKSGDTTLFVKDKTGNYGGNGARVLIMGETIIVNGKDITGNLGSKTTYGDYSPIIDNIDSSTVIIGNSNITQSYQAVFNAMSELKEKVVADSSISKDDKSMLLGDIGTVQSQLQKKKPNLSIVKESWNGIKKVLKAYGYAKTIIEIGKLIALLL